MKTVISKPNRMDRVKPIHAQKVYGWQVWVPYAAVVWSLIYAVFGIYWAVIGNGFPYTSESVPNIMTPLLGRFGSGAAWVVVMLAGVPAAVVGAVMLRGKKMQRTLLITAGALLTLTLLGLMTSLELLIKFGYFPYALLSLFKNATFGQDYFESWTQWSTILQLICFLGGFLWLGATVCYARRSVGACLYCGRQDEQGQWTNPAKAAKWGRIAVYVAMIAPVFYTFTRYAWALGIPLGMSEEQFRLSQESGALISGLFLGTVSLVGAFLMLGLIQRWGEVFPRWMIGLAGRQVPLALAIVPALLVSVLLIVGGISIWSGVDRIVEMLVISGTDVPEIVGALMFQLGPTLLFPLWGCALAVATLGYFYRRRGKCSVCGRGDSDEIGGGDLL